MNENFHDIKKRFQEAEALYTKNELEEAAIIYLELEPHPACKAMCYYRLAQISNKTGDPLMAYQLFYNALTVMPDLFSVVLSKNNQSNDYVFAGIKDELEINHCPLCGHDGEPYWCYPLPEADGYNPHFNPIRLWLMCTDCNHLFAKHYPDRLFIYDDFPREAITSYFSVYSEIFSTIKHYTDGIDLLEVGIGGCECALVAREIGYNVFGIDVIKRHVEYARKILGLNAEVHDFVEFETDKKWSIIIMGDVLEHVSNPVLAIEKAYRMLHEGGVLWISTPNFESAFSAVIGHDDPMRKQTYHLNYFSRESLYKLLRQFHFEPVDYRISRHYRGSMEVISIKMYTETPKH